MGSLEELREIRKSLVVKNSYIGIKSQIEKMIATNLPAHFMSPEWVILSRLFAKSVPLLAEFDHWYGYQY